MISISLIMMFLCYKLFNVIFIVQIKFLKNMQLTKKSNIKKILFHYYKDLLVT